MTNDLASFARDAFDVAVASGKQALEQGKGIAQDINKAMGAVAGLDLSAFKALSGAEVGANQHEAQAVLNVAAAPEVVGRG